MQEFLDESRNDVLTAIIEKARRVTGHLRLVEADLEGTVEAWHDVLAEIPTARLGDCYLHAVRAHDGRGVVQPRELLDAWPEVRNRKRRGPPVAPIGNPDARCGLCDSEGWQRFEIDCPTVKTARVVVRGCACSYAPEAERKSNPLTPPDWSRHPDTGVWLPQTLAAIASKPCNCMLCKAEAAAVPTAEVDSKWTKFDPDFFQGLLEEIKSKRV